MSSSLEEGRSNTARQDSRSRIKSSRLVLSTERIVGGVLVPYSVPASYVMDRGRGGCERRTDGDCGNGKTCGKLKVHQLQSIVGICTSSCLYHRHNCSSLVLGEQVGGGGDVEVEYRS